MATKPRFEILNHGFEHCQYFQGCGVSFSEFNHCVTGVGHDSVEAYNDAVDQIWSGYDSEETNVEALRLPKRPRGHGVTLKNKVPADCLGEDSEVYWYVSIRFGRAIK